MTLDEIKALLDAFKQAAKYNPSGNVEVGRAAESAARAALLQAVEELHQNYLDAAESSNQHRKRAEAAEAKQDRLLAERDAANETARRVAAEREAVRVSATKCVEDVRVIGQRYRDNWSDFDGRTLKEELIEATWGLERALSSSPRAESDARCKAHGVPWPCEECEKGAPAPAIHLPHNPVPSGIVYAPQTATGEYRAPSPAARTAPGTCLERHPATGEPCVETLLHVLTPDGTQVIHRTAECCNSTWLTAKAPAARTAPLALPPICNTESAVGHHCIRDPEHDGDHIDKHGNRWTPAARTATTGAEDGPPCVLADAALLLRRSDPEKIAKLHDALARVRKVQDQIDKATREPIPPGTIIGDGEESGR